MAKEETKINYPAINPPASPEQTITLTLSDLRALIALEVSKTSTPKTVDELAAEHMRRARGQDRPPKKSDRVPCLSPLTKSTFTVVLQEDSSGRMTVVEMNDYQRPVGWDVSKKDGGLATDAQLQLRNPSQPSDGLTKKAIWELHKAYYMRDWAEIGPTADGRRELLDIWRVKKSEAQAAE